MALLLPARWLGPIAGRVYIPAASARRAPRFRGTDLAQVLPRALAGAAITVGRERSFRDRWRRAFALRQAIPESWLKGVSTSPGAKRQEVRLSTWPRRADCLPRSTPPSLFSPIVFKTPKPGYVIQSPDGSPFTRSMIQYDLIQALFTDGTRAFTPPPGASLAPHLQHRQLLTFREVYEESYICSTKITKRVRDSMRQDAGFARDHLTVRSRSPAAVAL